MYSDADIKGAVAATRKYLQSLKPGKQLNDAFMHRTDEEFYADVLRFTMKKLRDEREKRRSSHD